MADNLMAPAMQVLSGLSQAQASQDQHTAAESRNQLVRTQMQREQMQRDMENNLNLSKALMPHDKEGAYAAFNKALGYIGRSVTMENFDTAHGLFEQAADLKAKQDFQGMTSLLQGADQYLVNTRDRQRAAVMLNEAGQQLAEQRADTLAQSQAKSPVLSQAEEIAGMADAFKTNTLSPGLRDRMTELVGPDETEWPKAIGIAQQMLDAQKSAQVYQAKLFRQEPRAFSEAARLTAHQGVDQRLQADNRIFDLLMDQNRGEIGQRELVAKAAAWRPELFKWLEDKNAQTENDRLYAQLGHTQTSLNSLNQYEAFYGDAAQTVSQMNNFAEGLPDPSKPQTDTQAQDQGKLEGMRMMKGEMFRKNAKPQLAQLDKQIANAQQALADSKRRLAGRLGDPTMLKEGITEAENTIAANQAQIRLLTTENPWDLADMEENNKLLDGKEQRDATVRLDNLKAKRDEDMQIVADEKARLERKDALLRIRLPKAQQDAADEKNLQSAFNTVLETKDRLGGLQPAIGAAAKQFGVNAGKLKKMYSDYIGSGVYEADNALAKMYTQWYDENKKVPPHAEVVRMKMKVGEEYGIDWKNLYDIEKDPERERQMTLNMVSSEERKDIAEARTKMVLLDDIDELYNDKYVGWGDDLWAKFAGPANLLSEDESTFRSLVKKNAAELRKFYIGAAQTRPELKNIIPVVPDTDMSQTQFKAAMRANRRFMRIYLGERVGVPQELGMKTPSVTPSTKSATQPSAPPQVGTPMDKLPPLNPVQQMQLEQLKRDNPSVDPAVIEEFLRKR